MVVSFNPRDTHISRPLHSQTPWPDADPNWTRVSKLESIVIGAYEIRRVAPTHFRMIRIWVADPYRRNGLGTWLLGHAIGLAESKGAREIDAAPHQFYLSHEFEPNAGTLRLRLQPE